MIESALAAAHLRFRPIIMTSLAFVLGVLPLALATGAGSASQRAIGTGVLGGMVTGTALAVFFVPVFFVVVRALFKGSERQHEADLRHAQARGHRGQPWHKTGKAFHDSCTAARRRAAAGRLLDGSRRTSGRRRRCRRSSRTQPAQRRRHSRPTATIAWQDFFTDPRLAELIDIALANNRDLRVAVLNIEQARAQFQHHARGAVAHRRR